MSEPAGSTRHTLLARLIARPVTALMVLILIGALGLVAYRRIPVLLLPRGIAESELTIRVDFPDSSPVETADKLTRPIEDEIRTLPNVTRVSSRSSADGARIHVTFAQSVDMDLAYAEVQDRLERVKPTLPDGVGEVQVWRMNSDIGFPILYFSILLDEAVEDPFGIVEDLIQPRLQAVDGVAQVQFWGMVEDSLRIFVDPDRLAAHGLGLYDVVRRLQRDNFRLPAGRLDDGGREFLLRVDSSFGSVEEVENWPITGDVRVADVADVRIARSFRDFVSRVDGKLALTGWVTKNSDANTVATCGRVLDQLDELRSDPRLDSLSWKVRWNQADSINAALDNLRSSMRWGALFAVLVLWCFVRRITTTLLVALAIPTSLMAALVAVYFSGGTFNIVSLAGFTLAIGMLVDNSVVVAENVDRRRAEGARLFEAATSGAGQVSLAIVLSTLTTIVVFAPLVFMSGDRNARVYLKELALPIVFSLLASLLVAMIFVPIATVQLGRFPRLSSSSAAGRAYSSTRGLLVRYGACLDFALRHRFGVTGFALAVIGLGFYSFFGLEIRFEEDRGGQRVEVDVELPKRFTLAEASEVFATVEDFLLERKAAYGYENVAVRFRRTGGDAELWFGADADPAAMRELSQRLRDDLPRLPGVTYKVGFDRGEGGQSSVRIQLEGPEPFRLKEIGDDVIRALQKLPELTMVTADVDEVREEIRVGLDRDRVRRFGVSLEGLQGLIAWGVGGQRLPAYTAGTREIPMLIEFEEEGGDGVADLRSLDLQVDRAGGRIPLAALTDFGYAPASGEIRRENGVTMLRIEAQSFDTNSYRVQRRVAETLAAFPFPDGYGWSERGARRDYEADQAATLVGLVTGVIFVFLLMGILFESAVLPLAVLLAVPLSIAGAFAALFVTGSPLDSMAWLALVLLAGVVVNNGIVLVDRIHQLRGEGLPRHEAVLRGCQQRLRPVLMTALTTIFGLLPMALPNLFAGAQGGLMSYQSLAIATLGGLVVSTLMTLFIVPLFYTLFDDLGAVSRRLLPLAAPRAGRAPGATTTEGGTV